MKVQIETSKDDGTLSNSETQFKGEPDDFLDQYQAQHNFEELFYTHLDGTTKAIGRKHRRDKSGTTEVQIISFSW